MIAQALEDPDIIEILLNPDGSLWFDRLSIGRVDADIQICAADVERIIRLVAAHVRAEVHDLVLKTYQSAQKLSHLQGANP